MVFDIIIIAKNIMLPAIQAIMADFVKNLYKLPGEDGVLFTVFLAGIFFSSGFWFLAFLEIILVFVFLFF